MDWTDAIPAEMTDAAEDSATADFAMFIEKHRERVYRIARQMCASHEAADDIVQEAFLRAFRSLSRFDGRATMDTWMTRIVMNVALNRSRGDRRFARFIDRFRRTPAASTAPTPLTHVVNAEARDHVQAAVASLPPDQRAVVVLFDIEGMSCADVAATLGTPEGTVRSRLFHARKRLRQRLAPIVFGEPREPS